MLKSFHFFVRLSSNGIDLVLDLALYKEDQAKAYNNTTPFIHLFLHTFTHLMFILSLSTFRKYIYLAAHIFKHLFLRFFYVISYTLTTPFHILTRPLQHYKTPSQHTTTHLKFYCFATHKHISILFSTSLIKSHILESNTSYHYNLSSSSNNIHLPSYISLIHLTNYISHKVSICVSHIYYKPISLQIPTLITHTNYKYYIPQNIYILYHLYISLEISNTHTKALLLEGTNTSYKISSHGRHKPMLQKSFPWKAILFIISQYLKEHYQGEINLSA